jgi:hypothetical protein
MVTPPSALARNASGSNLALDFLATAESPCASVADYYRPTGAAPASLPWDEARAEESQGWVPLRKHRFHKAFWRADEMRRWEVRLRCWNAFCRMLGASIG